MRRRVSIYKSYSPERRQETAGVQINRSWVRAVQPLVFFTRRRRVRLLAAAYDLPLHIRSANRNTRHVRLIKEKEKALAGVEPPFKLSIILSQRGENTTVRSGRALAFKSIGRGLRRVHVLSCSH